VDGESNMEDGEKLPNKEKILAVREVEEDCYEI